MKANEVFSLDKKTGFKSSLPVTITKAGRAFYSYSPEKGKEVHFNLPAGKFYRSSVDLKECKPYEYNFKATRKVERSNLIVPETLKVKFAPNPNKATIYLDKGEIVIDSSFKDAGEVVLKHILYHEKGHFLYKTEEYCDEYAMERLLEEGYNKSQIEEAARKTFPPDHPRLKNCVHNLIKKAKKR
jgi:hypothetical protein